MSEHNDNVTLRTKNDSKSYKIPCFLCNDHTEIRYDKKGKPYFICDACGMQVFIRRKTGISKLENLISDIQGSLSNTLKVSALTIQLLDLKNRLQEIENKGGVFGIFAEDEAAESAKALIKKEIKTINLQINQLNQEIDKKAQELKKSILKG